MFSRDRRRQARHRRRSAPGPTSFDEVEPRRLDRPQAATTSYWGKKPLLPDRHAEVLQGPDRAQQRAADRHHQRHRHRAGAGVARAVPRQRASTRSSRAPRTARCVLSFNNAKAPLQRHAGAPGGPLRDRPQGAAGHLLGRPRQADRQHGPADRPVVRGPHRHRTRTTWPRPRRCSPSPGKREHDAAAAAARRCRMPSSCGQVVKSQLEQAGFKVNLDQLEFPAAWLTTVFKNADYDMSIIAHVEPRDMRRGVRQPEVLHPLRQPRRCSQDIAAADAGHRAGAGRPT